jgi:LPS-assembly lipoprotein
MMPRPIRRPDRRAALLLGFGGVLSGCGFHPVYMPSGDGPGAAAGLAEIEVKPMYERPGQVLREALMGRFGTEPGGPRKFDLQVNFWINGEAIGVLDFTQATRVRLTADANWTLLSHGPGQTKLVDGTDHLVDGFDIFDSQYFAVDLDNESIQHRMAEAMAERITLRLAMWFHQHPSAIG